jgi:hypothetical protein
MSSEALRIPIPFNDVHQIIGCSIWLSYGNIGIVDSILAEDCPDLVMVNVGQRNCVCDRDPSFFLSAKCDIWRSFVETNSKPFQFCFDDLLVTEWFKNIKNDEDEMACPCDWSVRNLVSVLASGLVSVPAMTAIELSGS